MSPIGARGISPAGTIVSPQNHSTMATKTEVGTVLAALNYKDSVVEKFDALATWLYLIPDRERRELLASIMWYCGADTTREPYPQMFAKFDHILSEQNK